MVYQTTEKEFKRIQRKVKQKNFETDLGTDIALTLLGLEKRIEKLEVLFKTIQSQSQKAYAKCLEIERKGDR
jgi:hypothetical protein